MNMYMHVLRLSDAYMRQYNVLALFEIMACRLLGAEPLLEPMLPYCQLVPKEHIQVIFYLKRKRFNSRKRSNAKISVSVC